MAEEVFAGDVVIDQALCDFARASRMLGQGIIPQTMFPRIALRADKTRERMASLPVVQS
jgi:hypothetical protein